jgi:Carbon-nitrogen hydrolase
LTARLREESVEVPSSATEELGKAARRAKAYLSVGVNELDGGTIYNAQLLFGSDGEIVRKHRKDGQLLAGPLVEEEGILTAEIDAQGAGAAVPLRSVGHYSRPDVFTLVVNDSPKRSVTSE